MNDSHVRLPDGREPRLAVPTVLLIGGAPGAGKTTLGRALASRVDAVSLTADDLLTAAKALTTPHSHPGLHVMRGENSIAYFTESPADRLIADTNAQHEAIWPAIENVIRKHACWGPPIVIDGWPLRPAKVVALGLSNVKSIWLVAEPAVLTARERQNDTFFGQSSDPGRMRQNFLARSLWFNSLIEQEAARFGLDILRQDGSTSVDDLCTMATHICSAR